VVRKEKKKEHLRRKEERLCALSYFLPGLGVKYFAVEDYQSKLGELMANEWLRDEYTISDDRARLDISIIHEFLSTESYWAIGRSVEKVQRSIDNSLPFGFFCWQESIH